MRIYLIVWGKCLEKFLEYVWGKCLGKFLNYHIEAFRPYEGF